MIDLRRRQESNLRSGNYRNGHMAVTMTLTSWPYAAIPVFLFVTPGGPVCRRPSAPAFGMTGIALARFPAGSGLLLIACSAPLVPASRKARRLMAMAVLACSLIVRLAALQPAAVPPVKSPSKSKTSCAPGGRISSAGWTCTIPLNALALRSTA